VRGLEVGGQIANIDRLEGLDIARLSVSRRATAQVGRRGGRGGRGDRGGRGEGTGTLKRHLRKRTMDAMPPMTRPKDALVMKFSMA
jgi:hypothetical protein